MINIYSLRFKIIIILVIVFFVMLLVHILYIVPKMKNHGILIAEQNQMIIAEEIAAHIDFFFQQGKAELEAIATMPAIVSLEKKLLDKTIVTMDGVTQFFNYFFVLDTTGRWISYPKRPFLVGDHIPPDNMAWVKRSLEQDKTIFMNVFKSKINTLVSGFSTPIHSEKGKQIGLLRGVLVVSRKNTATDLISKIKIGEHGYAYLIAANGWLLAHPHITLDYNQFHEYDYSIYSLVKHLQNGESGIMEYKYENRNWIAAYQPIRCTGWGVVVHQPKEDIVNLVKRDTSRFTGLLACAFVFAIILFVISLEFSLKPLSNLVHQIKTGNIQNIKQYSQKDEIGVLAKQFSTLYTVLYLSREEIKKKREYIKSIYEAANNISFIVTDSAGKEARIQEFSTGAERIFGYKKEEVLGQSVSMLHLPEDVEQFPEVFKTIKKTKQAFFKECTLVRKSGEKFPAFFTTYPIFNNAGTISAALGVSIDITEHKKAEKALQESEEKYRELFENSNDGIIIHNLEGEIININKKVVHLMGYNKSEILASNITDLYPAGAVESYKQALKTIVKQGCVNLEIDFKKKQGVVFPAEVSSSLFTIKKTQIVQSIIRDITERKWVEKALIDAEEKYRTVFETTGMATVIIKGDSTLTLVNSEFEKLCGYHKQDIEGKKSWTEFVLDKNLKRMEKDFFLRNNKKTTIPAHYELWFRPKDGSIKSVFLTTAVIPKRKIIVASFLDITERKQAEDQIRKNLKEKEVLLQEIHHRVKNNLNVMISLLNLQSSQLHSKKQAVNAFKESTDRIYAMAMVHEKLYESGNFTEINMSDYVKSLGSNLLTIYRPSAKITLSFSIDDLNLDINKAIPCSLILNELITNALKHAFPGRSKGKLIIIFKKLKKNKYKIRVKDNGVGLPEEYVKKHRIGSLGLHLITILTEQLDGKLSINSQQGTEICITFPGTLYSQKGINFYDTKT